MSPGTEPSRSDRAPQPPPLPVPALPVRIARLPARVGLLLAGLGSSLAAVLGGWWLVQPQRNAFVGDFDPLSLPAALPGAGSATLLLVLGTIGVFTVVAAWATGAVPVTGPSWMPVIGGRRVPVRVAVIPATGVGLAVTLAAGPMVAHAVMSGSVRSTIEGLVVLPLWLWGPASLIASWAYALRRRHDQPGQGQPGERQHSRTGLGPTTDGHPADAR